METNNTAARIAETAAKIAAARGNTVAVSVYVPNNYLGVPDASLAEVTLTAACNGLATEKQAQAALDAVWESLRGWMLCEEIKARRVRRRGFNVWRRGFWHMGHYCTEGFSRAVVAA